MYDSGFLWIIAVLVFVIIEAATYQLISIWFVFGATAGLFVSLAGLSFGWQIGIFLAVSLVLIVALRPVSVKLAKKQAFRSNINGMIGGEVLITERVNNAENSGCGKTGGMEWTVRSENGDIIEVGEIAEIKRIEGVKLIVEKVNQRDTAKEAKEYVC